MTEKPQEKTPLANRDCEHCDEIFCPHLAMSCLDLIAIAEAAAELRAAAGQVGKVELLLLGEESPEWARLLQACRRYDEIRRGGK